MIKKIFSTALKFLSLILLTLFFHQTSFGQVQLDRVSVTERSDQLGFVVRIHLSEAVDSIEFVQPETHFAQMILFSSDLQTDGYYITDSQNVIKEISIIHLQNGTGLEFQIDENQSFLTRSYFDVNGRDVLVSLQNTDREAVRNATADIYPLNWRNYGYNPPSLEEPDEEPFISNEPVAETEEGSGFQDFLHKRNPATLNRITPGDPMELYLRTLYLSGETDPAPSFLLGPSNVHSYRESAAQSAHPWQNQSYFSLSETTDQTPFELRFYTPTAYTSTNSRIPMGQNDGVLWQGRGTNYFFTAGAGVQYGPFTAVFRPQFAYSENLDFTLEEFDISIYPRYSGSDYQMYLTYADIPLRFGENSISTFDPGDSFIQVEYNGWAAGLSNERLWSGPAIHNPLIFSTNAPGFFHVFAGTNEPYQTSWGNIEGKWLWGGLRESDYFDENPTNNLRYVTALTMNYSPSYISGLHVGFTRAAYSYYPENGLSLSDIFMVMKLSQAKEVTNPDDAYVSMMSLFARWVFPRANFEMYAEWGRNDNKRKFRDFLAEPELNRGYVLGFLKNFEISSFNRLLLNVEVTNLENSSVTATQRDFNIWYTNPVISHGFTHNGQVLGAGIGPGSSTQQISLAYYNRRGMIRTSARRIAHHNDRHFQNEDYFRSFARWPQFFFLLDRHEIEIRYGIDLLVFLPYNLELEAGYRTGQVENRFNLRRLDIKNNQYSFTLRYNLGGFIR